MSGVVTFKHKSRTNPRLSDKDKLMRAYQELNTVITGVHNKKGEEGIKRSWTPSCQQSHNSKKSLPSTNVSKPPQQLRGRSKTRRKTPLQGCKKDQPPQLQECKHRPRRCQQLASQAPRLRHLQHDRACGFPYLTPTNRRQPRHVHPLTCTAGTNSGTRTTTTHNRLTPATTRHCDWYVIAGHQQPC